MLLALHFIRLREEIFLVFRILKFVKICFPEYKSTFRLWPPTQIPLPLPRESQNSCL